MSEEDQSQDLQNDVEHYKQCGFTNAEKERPQPPQDAPKEDLTQQFFQDCEQLDIGCVMIYNNFPMLDLMSAVELMDPKMDMGMVRMDKQVGLDIAVQQGLYESSWKEQLTIIDATLSFLVAYLEGQNIAQTLWTNVLLPEPNRVTHPVFEPLSHILCHIVILIRNTVQNAAISDEEDFKLHVPYVVTSQIMLKDAVEQVKKSVKQLTASVQSESDETKKIVNAIATRLTWLRLFSEMFGYLFTLDEAELTTDGNVKIFRPKPKLAGELASQMEIVSKAIYETRNLGLEPPDGSEDEDFSWLLAIEPELNRHYMPSTFPHKKEIPNREIALQYLVRLSTRLKRLFLEAPLPSNIGSLKALFDYAKQFNFNDSCTLSRGILQLLIFPMDEKILGDPSLALSKLLCNAMKETSYPTTFIEGSVANEDDECNRLLDVFVTDTVRVLLKLYQAMGNNLARQRDQIAKSIEQMKSIQINAERLDLRVAQLLENVYTHDGTTAFVYLMQMDWIKYYFELSFRLEVFVSHEYPYIYWYIGDRLNNMQTNALDRAGRLACEGMKQEMIIRQSKSTKDKKKNASRDNNKLMEKTKQKCEELSTITSMHLAEASLCMGIVKTVTALVKLGKIKVPMYNEHSEEMRFAHRMAPMLALGPPLLVHYSNFLDYSGYAVSKDKSVRMIVSEAIDHFQHAKDNYSAVAKQYANYKERADNLLYIAHYNQVAVRLLNENFVKDKKFEFQFTDRSSFYPLIKFV